MNSQPSQQRPTRILVVGRTGVGKSSIINSVVGADVAETGKWEPTTAGLAVYTANYRGSAMTLIDTPGFCDAGRDRSNDDRYLAQIEQEAGEIDLVLFVSKLDDTRVERSEYDTLEALTSKFSRDLWDRAVVVLTRADKFTRREYPDGLAQRSAVLRRAMETVIGDRAHRVPIVPVTNARKRNPDRSSWMATLWLTMLGRMSERGFDAFVLSTISRVVREEATEEDDTVRPRSPAPVSSRPRRRGGALPAKSAAPAPGAAVVAPPAPVRPVAARPAVRSYVTDGVPVQHKVVEVRDGIANITVNVQQVNAAQTVIDQRGSSGLWGALKAVGSWIVKALGL